MRSHFIDCMLFTVIHAFIVSLFLENPLMSFNAEENGKLTDFDNAKGVFSLVMGLVLIFIVMAGPMKHKLLNSIVFIVL